MEMTGADESVGPVEVAAHVARPRDHVHRAQPHGERRDHDHTCGDRPDVGAAGDGDDRFGASRVDAVTGQCQVRDGEPDRRGDAQPGRQRHRQHRCDQAERDAVVRERCVPFALRADAERERQAGDEK